MLRQVAFALACAITYAFTSQQTLVQTPAPEIEKALAPTGRLRVALLSGDATQAINNAGARISAHNCGGTIAVEILMIL